MNLSLLTINIFFTILFFQYNGASISVVVKIHSLISLNKHKIKYNKNSQKSFSNK